MEGKRGRGIGKRKEGRKEIGKRGGGGDKEKKAQD